jgi:hypothetical protein
MRGGSQSHLVEADDGHHYVVKFLNNPQHRRILVNELVSAVFLEYLGIASPPASIIRVTDDFLRKNLDVHLTVGTRRVEVETGWHFGSRYPGHPDRTPVYEYLPDALLPSVVNLEEFRAILVFDKWTGNADGRQSVFYRAMVRDAYTPGRRPGFVTSMIDHGFAFNGPNWEFCDSPLQGLYARRIVYEGVRSLDDFQPWLDLVRHFPEEVVDSALKRLPPDWIEDGQYDLERLMHELMRRRERVPELIESCREGRNNPFPAWGSR